MNGYDKKARVAALGIEKIEDGFYFSDVEKNALISVDETFEKINFIRFFEEEDLSQDVLYSRVKKCNDELIFSPQRAKKIAIYNIENDIIRYLDIPDVSTDKLNEKYDSQVKFNQIIVIDNSAYILGYSYPGIIKYHSGKMKLLNSWVQLINNKIVKGDTRGYTSEGYVIKDRQIYVPVGCCPCVLVIDMDTDEVTIKEVPCCFDGIGGIALLPDGKIALVGRGKNANYIVFWNPEENTCDELLISEEMIACKMPFYNPIVYDNKLFLFPLLGCESVYKVRMDNLVVEKLPFKNIFNSNNSDAMYPWLTMGIYIEENVVRFITGFDLIWHLFDLRTDEIKNYEIRHEDTCKKYYMDFVKKNVINNEIIPENRIPLNIFLKSILG